ncbi:hypothetical protein THAOC_30301, partial [Thalassiosira oceanica]
ASAALSGSFHILFEPNAAAALATASTAASIVMGGEILWATGLNNAPIAANKVSLDVPRRRVSPHAAHLSL